MANRSHARCKVCRATIHARHRFGMCKQCSDRHYARIQAQRKETKQRRAQRALVASAATVLAVLEEGPDMPDTKTTPDKPGRPVKRQLTDEEQVEILDAYTATNEPVQEITTRFNIHPTHIYNILERAGVTWRRGHPISFETWQARQAKPVDNGVPPETEKALENMLKLPVLPPRPEPVAPTPAVERRVAAPTEWKAKLMFMAEVSGLISLEAESMVEAIELLQLRWPDLRVTSIREA